ncbi:30s ribosomal protein s16 [Lasiodiplodia theobromae]|uniref:30s ribosomal protein s16 n=1 Tax=Lasiodiplodia theobromae TaxID=45133 RepID=UPI0015C3BAA6|nr:30s ribosomal protein s16 [Lasiodiplodia theobromae]KAF4542209.1 30s ribosomal protein s16 [Lasiodiplodia theobromae]
MAYVPPALRKKQQVADSGSGDKPASTAGNGFHSERLPRAEDVHDHYWPPVELEAGEGMRSTVHSTLNSSTSEPDRLKYIMLFKEANPRWEADHLIYVKTNLHYLPGSERFVNASVSSEQPAGNGELNGKTDDHSSKKPLQPEAPSSAHQPSGSTHTPDLADYQMEPIAVFEQVGNRSGGFRFIGYHKIARLQFLEPGSPDLVRMLEQKFSATDKFGRVVQQQRSHASWKASLEHRWAVMKLEKDEDAEKSLHAPDVKIHDKKKKDTPRKSVNELLKEMRPGNSEAQAEGEGAQHPS